jgi:hypothetical protein
MSGIVPQQREVTIPVLPQLVNQGFWAANTLKGMYRI